MPGIDSKNRQILIIISLVLLNIGCSSVEPHYDRGVDETGKPLWVSQGTQTSKTERGRIFLGVGMAYTQGDFSREANTANMRARDEVSRVLTRFIEVVTRDYIASGNADDAGFHPNEAPKYISEMTALVVPKAKVMEHWVDQRGDRIFAIAEIGYPQVQSLLSDSPRVNAGFKAYLNGHGEQVFDRIATQH